ncbi:hypothetical protein [Halapricum hydrolyticum]|uniref:Cbb3-type cytochrome c oxidase subunit I n=1 Tax=Halapricum hydrolyticum TaxID=2979991 RepID=A0AAE3IBF1_9EURY|nr:hypothetical protein [Halapricum hydrolyticum]MCU4716946.1 hypothetical protein [Halapricum hydrolyticum]MCU4725449.1 hypothetical protein [Halapricum hydrolyticum]
MQQLSGDLDTDSQPPLAIPVAHFVVGVAILLLGGAIAGLGSFVPGIDPAGAGSLHLLLAGWIGLTIMGAMTQFVPVWSGTSLHSRQLSVASLWLVALGVAGLVAGFLFEYAWLPIGGGVLLVGFWVFAYNIVRTLPDVRTFDITEGHFAFALASLLVATVLGWLLAADISVRLLGGLIEPSRLLLAHLTLTVFGFVLATIVGALYQLAPMFTQAEKTTVDAHLAHVEMVSLPGGIALLAAGRLLGSTRVATIGGVVLLAGALAFSGFLARQLWRARVETGPLLRRYGLVTASLVGWIALTIPYWLGNPISVFTRFGGPTGTHLLFVGVFTLTIVGTFYHVVPFIVWYHRYSDRLGYESVPMVDDLYDDRIATVELWLLAAGLAGLWIGDVLATTWVVVAGGNLLGVGVVLFGANMAGVVWRHRPETVREVLVTLLGRSPG